MPGFEKVRKNLEAHGFDVTCFDTAAEAADYLDRRLDGKTVGHGGSITLKELGLLDRLQSHAVVRSHWLGDSFAEAAAAPVYLTSVNALAETGELINIDGTGNRVASTIFGHEEVYFIVDDRAKVVKCLVDFIDKVTKKERPSKAEVEVLPEVVRALREFITVQNS